MSPSPLTSLEKFLWVSICNTNVTVLNGSMWLKLFSNVQQIMMYRNTTEFALWSIDQCTYYYNYGNITQYLLINMTNSQIKHHRQASLNLIITGGLPGTAFIEMPIFQFRMTRIMRTSIESIFNCRQPNGESSVKEHYTCPRFKFQYSTFYFFYISTFWVTVVKCSTLCYRTVVCWSICPVCNIGVFVPNSWMDLDEMWHEGRPWPRPHCIT